MEKFEGKEKNSLPQNKQSQGNSSFSFPDTGFYKKAADDINHKLIEIEKIREELGLKKDYQDKEE